MWNWEIDARFTGHHYELAERLAQFGRKQPRRGVWERNARFYIPELHGDYDTSFRDYVQHHEQEGVWGPLPLDDRDPPRVEPTGPAPPHRAPEQDNYEWGVGEDADFITFLPIFHPIGTEWVIRNEVYGYLGRDTPRRACLITHSRLSRRLLLTMDGENMAGRTMGSELFPSSVALLHGLKAVSAPHPVYNNKYLPVTSLDKWFNAGVNGRAGSTENSPFGWGRETRFREVSWYYRANLAGRLYWPFLGWEKAGKGGELVSPSLSNCYYNEGTPLIELNLVRKTARSRVPSVHPLPPSQGCRTRSRRYGISVRRRIWRPGHSVIPAASPRGSILFVTTVHCLMSRL